MTPEITKALSQIYKGKKSWPKSLQDELLAIAHHEQLNVLQPLIYDDVKLKETLDTNHAYSRRSNWLAPPFQVVFSAQFETDDEKLKVKFDPPEGVIDWVKGSDKSLANQGDRMEFVNEIAKKFNDLMGDPKYGPYMLAQLRTIRGWLNE